MRALALVLLLASCTENTTGLLVQRRGDVDGDVDQVLDQLDAGDVDQVVMDVNVSKVDQGFETPAAGDAGVDAGADSGPSCPATVKANTTGFALGYTCSGGSPASTGCHASCTLGAAQFVGCVQESPYATYCYANCSACP